MVFVEAYAADVTFQWDYRDSSAAGYALYCGNASIHYTSRLDVGNTQTFALSLPDETVQVCCVIAYDSNGVESACSNEVGVSVSAQTGVVSVLPLLTLEKQAAVVPTATGFAIRFDIPFDSTWLNLYGSEQGAEGLADVTLVGATTGPVRGSLVVSQDRRAVTFVKTGGVLAPDTYTLTIASRYNSIVDAVGRPLDADGDGAFGHDYVLAFAVTPNTTPVLSIDEFARGPGQKINLPAVDLAAGLPVSISNGAVVHDVGFTLRYNPALLSVSDVNLAKLIHGDLTVKSIDQQAGLLKIHVANLSGLTDVTTLLLSLQAEVPLDAPYGAQHVLDLGDLEFNGGTLSGRDDDGLHVVAKLGDTNGDGRYTATDSLLMQRVIVRLDSGFSAYPTIDPVIVGDVNASGKLDTTDALMIQMKSVRYPVPQIPD